MKKEPNDSNGHTPWTLLSPMESNRSTELLSEQEYGATADPEGWHSSEHPNSDDEDAPPIHWTFADFGNVPERSRDGSIHATDEVINASTHLAASMLSLLGSVLLIAGASSDGAPWKIVSFSIYGASLVFLFVCSTLHHSIASSPKVEERLRMLDYLAIYPLIAGTFTPPCLVFFHDSIIGWSFCMVVWVLAIFGMIMTCNIFEKIPKWLSMTMYITLGWLGAFMSYWLYPVIGPMGMLLFVLGGVCYTAGGYVYSTERPNPVPGHFGFHEIWHLAVMLAAAFHWCMMYFYILPYRPDR